jgi:hypothetical protein
LVGLEASVVRGHSVVVVVEVVHSLAGELAELRNLLVPSHKSLSIAKRIGVCTLVSWDLSTWLVDNSS